MIPSRTPCVIMVPLHRGRLDVHFTGIDDLVFVGARALDRLALGFLDLLELELDLLARVLADLNRLRLGLVSDPARFHLIRSGTQPILDRLELALGVHRHRMGGLLDARRRRAGRCPGSWPRSPTTTPSRPALRSRTHLESSCPFRLHANKSRREFRSAHSAF